ncbi:Nif11-like leader peptide family natural product precursor, partial [Microcoleus sp. T2B6]|uniref:Nif11-like leader peptide family natural product precursor n=1 Tax=Microcoleus sp. T2B6 TaxID=3055424 RepID=UPI002FD0C1F0
MAIENVVKLLQAAQENPELASKLETVTSSEQVVEIGAGEGLEFTTEEAEAFRQKLIAMTQNAENGELSEEELDDVAGGFLNKILNFSANSYDTMSQYTKGVSVGFGPVSVDVSQMQQNSA